MIVFRKKYVIAKARMLHRELALSVPPVDIQAIIRSRNIWISYAFVPNLDAMAMEYNKKYYIVIKPTRPERDRWSLAHEFGHIFLGHFKVKLESTSETIQECSEYQHKILDREANIFARELLMPAGWVKTAVGNKVNISTIGYIKKLFGISWEAAIIRLDELGIVPRYQSLEWLSKSKP